MEENMFYQNGNYSVHSFTVLISKGTFISLRQLCPHLFMDVSLNIWRLWCFL